MKKSGNLYSLKNNFVLFSESSDYDNGIWKAVPPFYKLPKVFDEGLILAIINVLTHSKERVHFPSDYSAGRLLKEATNLTFGKLQAKGVKLVSLSEEGNTIKFSPNKIIGDNKGFTPLNEKAVNVEVSKSENEILRALEKVLLVCE